MTQMQSKNGTSLLPAPARAGSEEVGARPTRRRFTAQYELSILREAEGCAPGELGALLRRKGRYASHRTSWRKQREPDALRSTVKSGARIGTKDPQDTCSALKV